MKLQDVSDGRIDATAYRTVLRESTAGEFRRLGELPTPASGLDALRYRGLTGPGLKRLAETVVGQFPSVNVWRLEGSRLLATASRWAFASGDGGRTWRATLELPPSSGTMGVLPSAVCHHRGTTYLGEYPLRTDATPRIWRSGDFGRTWTVAVELADVRHVHAVAADPYADDVWVTTGDTDAESRIGRLRDGEFRTVGGGDQRWRAVQPAFTPSSVLWGMDSVYTDRKRIFRLDRTELAQSGSPDVEPVGTVSGSVYYAATLETGSRRWVAFSTAAEVGGDRTAPAGETGASERARVLVASDASGYTDWSTIASYRRRPGPLRRGPLADRVPAANAYVFLAADPDRGICLNPYNTTRHAGQVRTCPPAVLERLE